MIAQLMFSVNISHLTQKAPSRHDDDTEIIHSRATVDRFMKRLQSSLLIDEGEANERKRLDSERTADERSSSSHQCQSHQAIQLPEGGR